MLIGLIWTNWLKIVSKKNFYKKKCDLKTAFMCVHTKKKLECTSKQLKLCYLF